MSKSLEELHSKINEVNERAKYYISQIPCDAIDGLSQLLAITSQADQDKQQLIKEYIKSIADSSMNNETFKTILDEINQHVQSQIQPEPSTIAQLQKDKEALQLQVKDLINAFADKYPGADIHLLAETKRENLNIGRHKVVSTNVTATIKL